jgi:hypothetical protein
MKQKKSTKKFLKKTVKGKANGQAAAPKNAKFNGKRKPKQLDDLEDGEQEEKYIHLKAPKNKKESVKR